MTESSLFNVAAQMVAAFLIFVTGFAALFGALVVSSGVIWILWRCVDRLSALISKSDRSRWMMLESQRSALPASTQSRSTANRELIVTTPRL